MRNLFKNEEGKLGEKLAVDYLIKQGYKIIEQNFRIRGGEIDIISLDPTDRSGQVVLVFTEVKTRKSSDFGTPLEAIGPWKLRSLIKTAYFYKSLHSELPEEMRIDAIAIILDNQNRLINLDLVKNIVS